MARFSAFCRGGPFDGDTHKARTAPRDGDHEYLERACFGTHLKQVHLYRYSRDKMLWLFVRSIPKADLQEASK